MSYWKSDKLQSWILGTAATGLLWHSSPAIGNAENAITGTKKANSVVKIMTDLPTAQPKPLRLTKKSKSSKVTIQTVSQMGSTDGQKSEVQKQLELLYQQDGRPMPPDATFNLQPLSASQGSSSYSGTGQAPNDSIPSGRPVYRANRPATTYSNQTNGQTYQTNGQTYPGVTPVVDQQNVQQAKPRQTVVGMLKKKFGPRPQMSTQVPVPPDFNTAVPGMATYNSNAGPVVQQQLQPVRYPEPAQLSTQPAQPIPQLASKSTPATMTQSQSAPFVQSVAGVSSINTQLPQPTPSLPPLSEQPVPIATTTSNSLPPLFTEPQGKITSAQTKVGRATLKQEARTPTTSTTSTDFPEPFPAGTERDLERKPAPTLAPMPTTRQKPVAKLVIAPKVEPPVIAKAEPATVETASEDQIPTKNEIEEEPLPVDGIDTGDNPFNVPAKDFVEPLIVERPEADADPTAPRLDDSPAKGSSLDEPRIVPEATTRNDTPVHDDIDFLPPVTRHEPLVEKMQKIHERAGMKGLKGFCPVALRDQRELIDAKPEFHFTHRRQKFHFSSAEARKKFEANPLRYKPAAYGADVVALSCDKDVVEGTLDFAAWYKGRLFLFGSQETYDIFVKDPAQYATAEGME